MEEGGEKVPHSGRKHIGRSIRLYAKKRGALSEMARVRYVAQGFRNRDKPHKVHDASSLRASSVGLILFAAASLDFCLFSYDVAQAYLQSKYRMTRDVYISPRLEDRELFGLNNGEILKLTMPLYGICDAGDYWSVTVHEHNVKDLGMLPPR